MTGKDKIPDQGRAPAAEAVEAEPTSARRARYGEPPEPGEHSATGETGETAADLGEPRGTGVPQGTTETETAAGRGETEAGTGAEMDTRLEELHDRWLRAVAELDNLRKRTARDIARQRLDERARVAAEWLPVIDNLELALQHAHAHADADAVLQGIRAVRDQAVAVLTRLGYPRVEDLGTRFDPARHEAVSTAEDPDAEPGTVVAVVRPGYGDGPDQLRPASVVVSTKAED